MRGVSASGSMLALMCEATLGSRLGTDVVVVLFGTEAWVTA